MSNFLAFNDNKIFFLVILFSVIQLIFDVFVDNKKTKLLIFIVNAFLISSLVLYGFDNGLPNDLLKIENKLLVSFNHNKLVFFLSGLLIFVNFIFRIFLEHYYNLLANKYHKKFVIFLNICLISNLLILASNNIFTNLIFTSILVFLINIFVDETALKNSYKNFQITNFIFYFQNFILFIIALYSIKYQIDGYDLANHHASFQDNYNKYQLLLFLVYCYVLLTLFMIFYYCLTKNKINIIGEFIIIFFGYIIPIFLTFYKISYFNFLIENYSLLLWKFPNLLSYSMILIFVAISFILIKNIFSEKVLLFFLFQIFFYHLILYNFVAKFNSTSLIYVIMSLLLNGVFFTINYLSFFNYLKLSNANNELKNIINLAVAMPINSVFFALSLLSNIGLILSPIIVVNYGLYKTITVEKQYFLLSAFTVNFLTFAIIFILFFKSFLNYKNFTKDSFDQVVVRKVELDYLANLSKILLVVAMIAILIFRKHLSVML